MARLSDVIMKTTATTTVNLLRKRRPTAAEHRLAGTAERSADFGAFARLQQNGTDHEEAGDEVNDDDECA